MPTTSSASARFNSNSQNYATSAVHQRSPTIDRLHALLAEEPVDSVCDVGCGAGHLGLSFAGRARRIVLVDPAPNMLAAARQIAAERDVSVETCQSRAEEIPLSSGQFDLVCSRLAAHHFSDVGASIAQIARIVRPGGTVAIIDHHGDDDPEADEFNHRLELLHDPTHVRSYTKNRWLEILRDAGITVAHCEAELSELPSGLSIKQWCEIASSGAAAERQIRQSLCAASATLRSRLGVWSEDGEFYIPVRTLLILGRTPRLSDSTG